MRSVAAAFDADYLCLGREDGYTYDEPGLRRDPLAAIRTTKADVLFTHWTTDYNADHVVTAKAVTDAALFANLASFPTDPTPELAAAAPLAVVPRIWYVDPGAGYGFEATHFVELSPGHAERKAELIRYHRSQMDVMRRLSGTDYAVEPTAAAEVTPTAEACVARAAEPVSKPVVTTPPDTRGSACGRSPASELQKWADAIFGISKTFPDIRP